MTDNLTVVLIILTLVFVVFYLAYVRPSLGAGSLKTPENMTQEDKAKLAEEMKSTLLWLVLISVVIIVSTVLGPRIYRRCSN